MKAFIKPFKALHRSVKIKIKLIFILIQLSEMQGGARNLRRERVNPIFEILLIL